MILYKRKLLSFQFSAKPLKQFLRAAPQYGSNQAAVERYSKEQARYIRITDIDEYGLLKDDLGVTAEFVEQKYLLKNKDVLFARSGATVGKAYLHKSDAVDYECFFAGYMIRFLVNENLLLPEFLFSYTQLDVYKEWKNAIQRAAGQPNINAEEYKSLPVPVPPLKVQKQIIKKFAAAYNAKRAKEAEAKSLLDGIDAYLLERLGIETPAASETQKTFFIYHSKLSGDRLDPLYYRGELFSFLETTKYQTRKVKNVIVNLKSGFGAGKQDQDQEEKGIIQIRPTNIGTEGNLKFDKNVFLPFELLETQQENLLQRGDVLFNNTNSQELVGKTVYFDEDGDFLFSNHITRIRTNESKVSPQYLALILNTYQHRKIFYSICTNWNNQSGVGNDLLNSLKVPVPPLEVQEEIAAHIQSIRTRAGELEREAREEVERAKGEVERMILGGE